MPGNIPRTLLAGDDEPDRNRDQEPSDAGGDEALGPGGINHNLIRHSNDRWRAYHVHDVGAAALQADGAAGVDASVGTGRVVVVRNPYPVRIGGITLKAHANIRRHPRFGV